MSGREGTHLDVYHVDVFAAAILSRCGREIFIRPLLSLGGIARARESPLTRVELRCHCSRDSTISRFLATVYQVCRHYVASEMENISQRGDIAEGVLNITRAEFSPMPASHKYAKLSLQKYVRTVGVGYSLFSLWLKFNVHWYWEKRSWPKEKIIFEDRFTFFT